MSDETPDMSDTARRIELLENAYRVLVRLVREEYPSHYSLAEIAYYWGSSTEAERQALDELEAEMHLR